jgi:hypothetical protein
MSPYNIQPSISLSRTVVEMSRSVLLNTAMHVHMQRIEVYCLKGLVVQRTGTVDMELQGISEPIFCSQIKPS